MVTLQLTRDNVTNQYFGEIKIGSELQKMPLKLDLYSPIVIVPGVECSSLNCTGPRFNQSKSTTFSFIDSSNSSYSQLALYFKRTFLNTSG